MADQEAAGPAGSGVTNAPDIIARITGSAGEAPIAGAPADASRGRAPASAPPPERHTTSRRPATIAGGEQADRTPQVPADWPQDWRQKFAGEDRTVLKQLDRFQSPADLYKSYRALQQRLSSGELKEIRTLPENATPEQLSAWRTEHGVPQNAEGYVAALALPSGVVPGAADKPLLESFSKAALDHNWSPQQFNQAVGWYYQMQDRILGQREEADEAFFTAAMQELMQEWGPEFKRNQNAIGNLLALAPDGVAEQMLSGRLANGQKIGNDPGVLRFLTQIARELNPASTLLPAGTGNNIKALGDRIAEIEGMWRSRDGYAEYWTGPKAATLQQEYRELVDAREKLKDRRAG